MRPSVTLVVLGLLLGVVPPTADAVPRIYTLAGKPAHARCVTVRFVITASPTAAGRLPGGRTLNIKVVR